MDKFEKILQDYDRHCQRIIKSTQVLVGERPQDKAKRIAGLEKDYVRWFEFYFPHYAKVPCADYHAKFSSRIIKNKKIKALLEIYRSGAKSVHADMGIPLFLMMQNELKFMLLIGETETKGKQLIGDIQAELVYNQRLKNDYGEKFKKGDWSDGNFYTSDGVRFMSLGFGQSPRGLREGSQRPDYIAIDDVDTKKHVNNDRIMGESVDYIMEEVLGCFDAADDATERLVFANNNFHRNSITNRLKQEFILNIKKDKEEGDKTNFEVFTVPAVKDLINFEPTWPQKSTSDFWRKKYLKRPRSFMREYMHMHVQEGKVFKAEWMQWKKMLPLGQYDALVFRGDLSYKDKGDFKAMWLCGKIGKEYHIIHGRLRQTNRTAIAKYVYDLYEKKKLGNYNIKYKIDGLFAQDEFISDFDVEGDDRGYYIPIIADKKSLGNKYDHIESGDGAFERLWVFWNIDEKDSIDQNECIDQFLAFEKGSQAHDDGPDDIIAAFKELDKMTFIEKFEPRYTKRDLKNKRF